MKVISTSDLALGSRGFLTDIEAVVVQLSIHDAITALNPSLLILEDLRVRKATDRHQFVAGFLLGYPDKPIEQLDLNVSVVCGKGKAKILRLELVLETRTGITGLNKVGIALAKAVFTDAVQRIMAIEELICP